MASYYVVSVRWRNVLVGFPRKFSPFLSTPTYFHFKNPSYSKRFVMKITLWLVHPGKADSIVDYRIKTAIRRVCFKKRHSGF